MSTYEERVDANYFGGKATKKEVTIAFGPPAAPKIHLLLVTPNKPSGPKPVFLGINAGDWKIFLAFADKHFGGRSHGDRGK